MTDRNKISFADKQMGLPKLDAAANELRSASHDEQRVAILVDLWPLVRVVCVRYGKIVQVELPLHTG